MKNSIYILMQQAYKNINHSK